MNNLSSFTVWLFKRIFGWVREVYQSYYDLVVDQPVTGFLPTFFAILVVDTVLAFTLMPSDVSVSTFLWTLLVVDTVVFVNYIRILLREQYKKFIKEQEQIFDILKDTKCD